jgi:hypothetical protein
MITNTIEENQRKARNPLATEARPTPPFTNERA